MTLERAELALRARWTRRRIVVWWVELLDDLARQAAAKLRIARSDLVKLEVEPPTDRVRGRRRFVFVRVHVLYVGGRDG